MKINQEEISIKNIVYNSYNYCLSEKNNDKLLQKNSDTFNNNY